MAQKRSPQARRDKAQNSASDKAQSAVEPGSQTHTLEPAPIDLTSPQLTLRAVLTGMLLGGLLSICTVYVGLKIGWVFGTSLTAALLGYGVWTGLHGLSGRRIRAWGILENNISQTTCSAAASVASAGLVAPIPALALLTGHTLEWRYLALWVFSVMLVGIAVAVPLRRQMLILDKLPFPAGIASAEMLREMHARGAEALARLKMLASAGLTAVAVKLIVAFKSVSPYALPFSIKECSAGSLTMTLNPTLLPVGIGGLIGFRACGSLLIGAILAYAVLSPQLVRHNYIRVTVSEPLAVLPAGVVFPEGEGYAQYDERRQLLHWAGVMSEVERDQMLARSADSTYRQAVGALYGRSQFAQPDYRSDLNPWLVWPGVTLMVVAALVSVGFSWRSIVAALPVGRQVLSGSVSEGAPSGTETSGTETSGTEARRYSFRRATTEVAGTDRGAVPRKWFVLGLLGALLFSVTLQISFFEIAWWAAGVGVLLTFVLALVAARVAGETGIGMVGPMGKITQLAFGFLVPNNPVPNLMAANVTGGAASQCADLLDDLKCGYLLGASPRLQMLAQLCGALAGALVGSAAYLILIPNPSEMLMTEEWAAPAAVIWKTVAELFMVGFEALPKGVPTAMALAALAGVALPVLERVGPGALRPLVLSPVSIGLGFVLPASVAFSIFIGGLVALLLRRWLRDWAARFLVAICVGLIAGESLTGIGVAFQRVLTRTS